MRRRIFGMCVVCAALLLMTCGDDRALAQQGSRSVDRLSSMVRSGEVAEALREGYLIWQMGPVPEDVAPLALFFAQIYSIYDQPATSVEWFNTSLSKAKTDSEREQILRSAKVFVARQNREKLKLIQEKSRDQQLSDIIAQGLEQVEQHPAKVVEAKNSKKTEKPEKLGKHAKKEEPKSKTGEKMAKADKHEKPKKEHQGKEKPEKPEKSAGAKIALAKKK